MDNNKKMYQLFVIVMMLVLLTGGILVGLTVSKGNNDSDEIEISEDNLEKVSNENVEVYNNLYEEVDDVEIVYVDIYSECNHSSEKRSNEYSVNFDKVKKRELEEIQNDNSGYELIQDTNNILVFEKIYTGKCENHYMLKLEKDTIVIYRYDNSGEYVKYQETDILKENIRPDLLFRLEEGIEAETVEELYMFLEELES